MSIISNDISNIASRTDLKFLKNKKILITGASGLVGSYFAQTLQHLITIGEGPSKLFLSSKSGKFQFNLDPSTEVIVGDITNLQIFSNLPNLDIIIHAAGYGQPTKFLENPLLTIALNTTSTLELIKKVNSGGKFLFISSSEVYSGLKTPPFIEDQIGTTNTNHIRSAYIEGKRTGEAIVATTKRTRDIDAKSVRLSLAYGPGTKTGDSRAINTFIQQAITSSRIVLKDDGHAMRTYCYITDAIEMCLNVLDKGENDIYNVAGNSRVSILDLARLIAELSNAEVNLPENSNDSLKGAPEDVLLDLTSTLSLSNKSEFVSLKNGVQNTINWQMNELFIV